MESDNFSCSGSEYQPTHTCSSSLECNEQSIEQLEMLNKKDSSTNTKIVTEFNDQTNLEKSPSSYHKTCKLRDVNDTIEGIKYCFY